jgi:hypothetical protein
LDDQQAAFGKLIELGLVEMREETPYLTIAGQNTVWWDGKKK